MRIVVASALALVVTAIVAAPAGAGERWAAPTATRTAEPCLAIDPCSFTRAVTGAATADEVLLEPGRYVLPAPLVVNGTVTLRGARTERPVLVGTETSEDDAVLTLRNGGTLRHVELQATRGQQDALALQNAVAEDVLLSSAGGNGAKVYGAPSGTVLRDAVVSTAANDSDRAALRLKELGGAGDVMVRNVTALAPATNGIRCEVSGGTATIVNSVVRGGRKDIKASGSSHCEATYSNFRTTGSPTGAGNQDADPLLDADGRPTSGSPLIDAGTPDALLGATDPAGCARSFGGAPDIGAYELCSAPVVEPPPPPAPVVTSPPVPTPAVTVTEPETPAFDTQAELPPDVPAPVQGTSMVVSPSQGKVLFREPGTNRFRELEAGAQIPVGSEIDASNGKVTLVTSVAGGLQDGTFWGGRFTVSQRRAGDGMTSLVLKGGSFKGCPKPARATAAAASKKKPVRKLWSKDKNGRFRTHGHNSVATARGTNWLTEDTCAGTRTRVLEGAVAVRDTRRKRTTVVRAGRSYLARR